MNDAADTNEGRIVVSALVKHYTDAGHVVRVLEGVPAADEAVLKADEPSTADG